VLDIVPATQSVKTAKHTKKNFAGSALYEQFCYTIHCNQLTALIVTTTLGRHFMMLHQHGSLYEYEAAQIPVNIK